jgi:predicted DNA-binding protein YlxM (UPF0122 family)
MQNAEDKNEDLIRVSDELNSESTSQEQEHFEEESNELVEDFSSWDKKDMLEKLQGIITADEIEGNTQIVLTLRDLFRMQVREYHEIKLKEYVEQGGLAEDFEGVKNEDDQRFEELLKKFFQRKKEIRIQREKELIRNLTIKKDIIEDLKKLAQTSENLSEAFQAFHELQAKWRETGKVPQADAENLWQNYKFYVDRFFDVVNLNKELRDLDASKNLELKTILCQRAEQAVSEPNLRKALNDVKSLKEEWKDIGYVPKSEADLLRERFMNAVNLVAQRQKEHSEGVKVQLDQNLRAKVLLCDEMEKLLEFQPQTHKSWQEETAKAENLMAEWKKIGFVPKSDNGETWNRFKSLRKRFYGEREKFYDQKRDVFTANLKAKTDLCEKAEALKDSTDWDKTANELKNLQARWKQTGPVAPKHSDKIWKRFRAACDEFFENKAKASEAKNSFLKLNALKAKEIITKVEDFQPTEDAAANTEAIKAFQEEFRQIGDLNPKEKEDLNFKFNNALDKFFGKIKDKTGEDSAEIHKLRFENLLQSEEGKNKIRKDRRALEDRIKRIQAEVTQMENNMGFFAKSKNAGSMLSDFQNKIDAGKAEMKKLKDILNRMPRV